jgi:hypothetical protein
VEDLFNALTLEYIIEHGQDDTHAYTMAEYLDLFELGVDVLNLTPWSRLHRTWLVKYLEYDTDHTAIQFKRHL